MNKLVLADARTLSRVAQKAVMADRKAAVMELVLKGDHQGEIATALGISVSQVKAAIAKSMRDAQKVYEAAATTYRGRLLAKNHRLQTELWAAYNRVKDRGKVSQVLRKVIIEGREVERPVEITQATAPEAEARLLQAILQAQAQEGRIFGLGEDKAGAARGRLPEVAPGNALMIVNNADLDDDVPWIGSIPRGYAEQGVGLLPPGSPDPGIVDAEVSK
jgi:DNA-binding CsgD family transcriptional regulator